MSYKWRPSKSQRREFAQKMQDPTERAAYEARKEARAENRRAKSNYNYNTAGGSYKPTAIQYETAIKYAAMDLTDKQRQACEQVIYGHTCDETIHHDHIHVINEMMRSGI